MDSPTKSAPPSWLMLILAGVGLAFTILWAYIQIRHWKDPGVDSMMSLLNAIVTLLICAFLVWAAVCNLRDSRRARRAEAQARKTKDQFEQDAIRRESSLTALSLQISEWAANFQKSERRCLEWQERDEQAEARLAERSGLYEQWQAVDSKLDAILKSLGSPGTQI